MKSRLPAVVLALATLSNAYAVEYTDVNPTASTISFTYDQMGQEVYGTFGTYSATLNFDTQNPAAASTVLTIQLPSINAGSDDANTELPKPGWFDMTTYPVGTFTSTHITDLGDNRYLFSGNLTLKGQTGRWRSRWPSRSRAALAYSTANSCSSAMTSGSARGSGRTAWCPMRLSSSSRWLRLSADG